jgi:tetratricopeptide (TPR) repeat protein
MNYLPLTLALTAALVATPVLASEAALDQSILEFQHQWEHVNYELPADQKVAAFETLEKQEAALVQRYPNRAEPLIWHGIILSSLAGAKGGLGALGLAKEARDQLLASEKIDPSAMLGSADTSLGTLYFKVPGWPIGFGDDDKAENYLKQALRINPNGIDPNYFYADFLYGKHRYPEAMQALEKALAAAPRPSRPLADKGRRQEIQALMAKVRDKAGDSLKSVER